MSLIDEPSDLGTIGIRRLADGVRRSPLEWRRENLAHTEGAKRLAARQSEPAVQQAQGANVSIADDSNEKIASRGSKCAGRRRQQLDRNPAAGARRVDLQVAQIGNVTDLSSNELLPARSRNTPD